MRLVISPVTVVIGQVMAVIALPFVVGLTRRRTVAHGRVAHLPVAHLPVALIVIVVILGEGGRGEQKHREGSRGRSE